MMENLEGRLLIAMPSLADPNFHRTVILLASHSAEEGAFGLVINRPTGIDFSEILQQLDIESEPEYSIPEILVGGPVQPDHGFLLMLDSDFISSEGDLLAGEFSISGRTDLLRELLEDGNSPFHLCLGYSGWAAGQLEAELEDNAWLIAPSSRKILFDTPSDERWEAALAALGVQPGTLVDLGGSQPS